MASLVSPLLLSSSVFVISTLWLGICWDVPSASMVGRTITRARQAAKTSKAKTVRKSSPIKLEPHLVGGFNPSEKYLSNRIISPSRGENKKYLKPPPSHLWLISLKGPGVGSMLDKTWSCGCGTFWSDFCAWTWEVGWFIFQNTCLKFSQQTRHVNSCHIFPCKSVQWRDWMVSTWHGTSQLNYHGRFSKNMGSFSRDEGWRQPCIMSPSIFFQRTQQAHREGKSID